MLKIIFILFKDVVTSRPEGDLRGNLSSNKKPAFIDFMARRNRFKNDAVDPDYSARRKPGNNLFSSSIKFFCIKSFVA